ncbi:uncharacterized protein F5891DRAFT_1128878 [Suillus fuscotomentosus]|uniref:Uncharacterized protein n=1 Tax=Suillus fuscotomentosus TaxID=1912939 RepID=A0AAD4E5J1_9AGAM|nr:uncharacterized protein F5891DRAFT_1128878 [Suillus fuscotomentosus]KAG1899671.1 hypothetical protein F5891DRAFT_1128878 [Suillus fuscotomentosus]
MPHKRAKRVVREQERSLKGHNLPPKHLGNEETVPKSVARILNAEKIRLEFREKKRKIDEPNGDESPQLKRRLAMLKIQPGETIAHFNKRVESSMMPLIRTAMQQSSAQVRRVQKREIEQGVAKPGAQVKTMINDSTRADVSNPSLPPSTNTPLSRTDALNLSPLASTSTLQRQHRDKPKEFRVSSTSAPRRLNDIAQEPPRFDRLPRGARSGKDSSKEKVTGILSMAQKAMMEEERENVIKRYRELKAKKLRSDCSGAMGE